MENTPARVMVTAHQLEHHGEQLRTAGPEAHFLSIDPDGTVRDGDQVVVGDDAKTEIAFGSTDLFDGDLRDDKVRHFFGWLLGNDRLQWLHMAAAGVDNPVFGMLLDGGVRLTTSHHTAVPISEYVLAQVLRARLPLDAMADDRRERTWRTQEWDEVAASRWLVVGLGAIGTEVAIRARAFGAHVTGVRRTPTGAEPVDALVGPDQFLSAVGRPRRHRPLRPGDERDHGHDRRRPHSPGWHPERSWSTSAAARSIDEDALRVGLEAGQPAAAVLDVTATEPLPEGHWLWNDDRVVLTSHTSSGGRQRAFRAADIFAGNLSRWFRGDDLADEVTAADRDAPSPG